MMLAIPEEKCHRKILGHRKYFARHDRCNLMEVIYNQNNMYLINIQHLDRIDMFEDCNMLLLIYSSIENLKKFIQ
jgi:hypothetical protein